IGLSAKNAILIVEFARERIGVGDSPAVAGVTAAKIRLRPILMTAFAFILGSVPLAIAMGAGANSRRSIGTTVVGGMSAATVLIILIPVFFILVESTREWFAGRKKDGDTVADTDNTENESTEQASHVEDGGSASETENQEDRDETNSTDDETGSTNDN
ncbi:MAG: hypothetical protein GY904_31845, partial [Planctomycetaceae bacterium]|nr:hypothetical protein [Planctomycetaceae bacterium]